MTTYRTSRSIPATPQQVFAAITDPQRLARWWGPAGFSNTFKVCELKPGGAWSFVMHGPDGKDYPNESVIAEIEAPRRFVVSHASKPVYRLELDFTPSAEGTNVAWAQTFEDDAVAKAIEFIVVPANEQNLDRLVAEVLGQKPL
jgi:uncharacterized protein YndB with AHSA1/START domain